MVGFFSSKKRDPSTLRNSATWSTRTGNDRDSTDELGRSTGGSERRSDSHRMLRRSASEGSLSHTIGPMKPRYGYWPADEEVDLDFQEVEQVILLCGKEIRATGLDQPLLFSSRAMDLNAERILVLIKAYVFDRRRWVAELPFANCHDLCAMIKWALSRLKNQQGGRGFLAWEVYERWRISEKEKRYPPRSVSMHLLQILPTSTSALLSTLLDLMSRTVAYTTQNGTTPRKLSSLLSGYVFGLPCNQPFEATYKAHIRYTYATEHLLLAFIRDRNEVDYYLPVHLLQFVRDYPASLPTNVNRLPSCTRHVSAIRISRLVRFFSKDLISAAGTWDVSNCPQWAAALPALDDRSPSGDSPFDFSWQYRKLLNLGGAVRYNNEEYAGFHFRNVAEKDWASFQSLGFHRLAKERLRLDLHSIHHSEKGQGADNVDWTRFEKSGFNRTASFLRGDLAFDPSISDEVRKWPHDEHFVNERLRKVQNVLPPFAYDTTPHVGNPVSIDEDFFEAWSDVLVASTWSSDCLKESSWALIQFDCRPPGFLPLASKEGNDRVASQWFLVEETIPAEYLRQLRMAYAGGRSRSMAFLGTIIRRKPQLYEKPVSKAAPISERGEEAISFSSSYGPVSLFSPTSEIAHSPERTGPSSPSPHYSLDAVVASRNPSNLTTDVQDRIASTEAPALTTNAQSMAGRRAGVLKSSASADALGQTQYRAPSEEIFTRTQNLRSSTGSRASKRRSFEHLLMTFRRPRSHRQRQFDNAILHSSSLSPEQTDTRDDDNVSQGLPHDGATLSHNTPRISAETSPGSSPPVPPPKEVRFAPDIVVSASLGGEQSVPAWDGNDLQESANATVPRRVQGSNDAPRRTTAVYSDKDKELPVVSETIPESPSPSTTETTTVSSVTVLAAADQAREEALKERVDRMRVRYGKPLPYQQNTNVSRLIDICEFSLYIGSFRLSQQLADGKEERYAALREGKENVAQS